MIWRAAQNPERLRSARVLDEHERRLTEAQAIAHVGSWEWDIKTNVVTWSDELRRMYGLPANAPAGYPEFLAIATQASAMPGSSS